MGLAAAYHALPDAERILVLEQARFGHGGSSSGGGTRQFRIQYAEEYMARLVLDSIPLWDDLERHRVTEHPLRSQVGSLWFGDPDVDSSEGQIKKAIEVMDRVGIEYEPLKMPEIERRFRFVGLPAAYEGFFQPRGGTIHVPGTVDTLVTLLRSSGRATLLAGVEVNAVVPGEEGVRLETAGGTIRADKVVLAAGPYTNRLLRGLGFQLDLVIWQMVSCYFRKRHSRVDYPSWFAFEPPAPHYDPGLYYGFEEVDWSHPGYIRVAPAFALHHLSDPRERQPRPEPMDLWLTARWVREHMPGLEPEPRFASTCLAALPADPAKKMFLDFLPASRRVVVFTAGWAFKFVPLIGKILADLAVRGETRYDVSPFRIETGGEEAPLEEALAAPRGRRLPF